MPISCPVVRVFIYLKCHGSCEGCRSSFGVGCYVRDGVCVVSMPLCVCVVHMCYIWTCICVAVPCVCVRDLCVLCYVGIFVLVSVSVCVCLYMYPRGVLKLRRRELNPGLLRDRQNY